MRILVTSDTHGDSSSLRRAILAQPEAEIVIHLGDGGDDVDYVRPSFPAKTFLQVRGNCDWGSALPPTGDYEILSAARDRKARVVLFGHTHQPRQDYEDGLYIMNPGRLSGWEPTYGTIDLTPQGIVLNIVKLPG